MGVWAYAAACPACHLAGFGGPERLRKQSNASGAAACPTCQLSCPHFLSVSTGFGGPKRLRKQNDASSAADVDGYRPSRFDDGVARKVGKKFGGEC